MVRSMQACVDLDDFFTVDKAFDDKKVWKISCGTLRNSYYGNIGLKRKGGKGSYVSVPCNS